ncbi:MAG: MurT ligase domain-containing protein [Acidimicrobiia bacterium]|nr:MurT ligase domain-containing protein [Acidimicrobiia bacterium]
MANDARRRRMVADADPQCGRPQVAQLAEHGSGDVVTFGIDSPEVALDAVEHATDANFCTCGGLLSYEHAYMGHVGVWRCEECGRTRGTLDVRATDVTIGDESTTFTLFAGETSFPVTLPVTGLYTVYNALAAYTTADALGLAFDDPGAELAAVGPVFGRQERMMVDGREIRLLLAKNPIGLNEVLRALRAADQPPRIVMFLNDGIADGRDISWVYDADLEQLAGRTELVIASGTRADELALRLDLAGMTPDETLSDTQRAVDAGLAATPPGGRLDLVLTYTAMLEVREALARRTTTAQYWETTP